MTWTRDREFLAGRRGVLFAGACALLLAGLVGCTGSSGGGGSPDFDGGLEDPVVPLKGTGGKYSRTPEEANASMGSIGGAPPTFPSGLVAGANHFIRIEFPFEVDANTILSDDASAAPFSTLNGNITITDQDGNHIPGIAVVNGVDVFGTDRSAEEGWPEDLSSSGRDRNIGDSGRFVYIATDPAADTEGAELASAAAFGGRSDDSDGDPATTDISQIRVRVDQVNGATINALWTINVGDDDATFPTVQSIKALTPVEGQSHINGRRSADITTEFMVTFDEPVVPQSVSFSARFNSDVFKGNLPAFTWPTPPTPPLPNIGLTAPAPPTVPNPTPLFIPFDCNPIGNNNLARYIIRPLITLPANTNVQLVVRAASGAQTTAAMDLRGNRMAGGSPIGDFETGDGPALVNAPVSPEVIYWTPPTGRGLGAIDLNGLGFSTNRPNAHTADDLDKTAIITKIPDWNLIFGRARDGSFNNYRYPVGTGSASLAYPNDPGNPGTPVPGVNEKSDGFETFVLNSAGEQNLTGGGDGIVGRVSDIQVGDMLDTVFFDTLNPHGQNGLLRASKLNFYPPPLAIVNDRNSIADPPTPNPPPLRYNLGLQPVGFVLDKTDPNDPLAFLIEGEEVFGIAGGVDGFGGIGPGPDGTAGTADDGPLSRVMLVTNDADPLFGPDVQPMPYFLNGPSPQSSTSAYVLGWTSRQQIGNFLYVADQTSNELKVLNSNSMRLISTIPLPDPFGLAIAPHNRQLFVSNFGDDTVSVVGTDPFGPGFHEEINRIAVGQGPRGIAVQPDFEDVLVLNWIGDSIDLIDPGRSIVRKSLTTLINRPFDVVVSDRQIITGFLAGVYFAYISNFGGNNCLVYESGPDSPPAAIGLDNVIGEIPDDADQGEVIDLIEPRHLAYDPEINSQALYASGAYLAHRDADGRGIISRMQFTFQAQLGPIPRNPPPGFFIPPGFSERRFEVVSQWGHTPEARLAGGEPSGVATADLNTRQLRDVAATLANYALYPAPTGIGANNFVINSKHPMRIDPFGLPVAAYSPDRVYVSFADTNVIQVLDPNLGGVILKTIEGSANVGSLYGYWSQ